MTQPLKQLSGEPQNTKLDSYVEKIANDLICQMATNKAGSVSDSYRRLLTNALAMAAEKQQMIDESTLEITQLRHLSTTDEITTVLNRRGFSKALQRTLEQARRSGETGFLVMIDLDGFKQINDSFGHAAGDKILKTVAIALKNHTRSLDSIARIGGDEFAVILNDLSPETGILKAKELENMINSLTVMWKGHSINIHASFGYEPYEIHEKEEDLLVRVDNNMYTQKRFRQQMNCHASG